MNSVKGYCIASNEVMQEGMPIQWIYKEKPDEEGDTGWRIFSGNQDESFMNEAKNFNIYDIENVIKIDFSIKELLGSPVGSEYKKEIGKSEWRKIR